ncbi:CrcB family protein [Fructobacillus sp. M158]|uniref:fluoride efflux transporter FluC n=1 Tax=Fructobacillus parabroussonetiae TaxID=2713174 RepID=UPI00200A3D83|nr:CrcB family protein [Fructobacillus parabroussonetiae]MCK8617511.1 CrcB family protein [Fructobacillus parabroussonetiae]
MPEEKPQLILLVVFLGGCLGGALRYLLSLLPRIGAWPAMTVFINTVGTGCLACLAAYMKQKSQQPAYVQSFIGTGLLGGFTTFGALILEAYQFLLLNQPWLFVALIACSWPSWPCGLVKRLA